MVSNAFDKSINIPTENLLLSIASVILSTISRIANEVDILHGNHIGCSYKIENLVK